MWDDFIAKQIQRTNRNILIIGFAISGIVGALIGVEWRSVYNHVFGPFPASEADLNGIYNPDLPKQFYLKVQGAKSYSTGMQEVDSDNKSNVRAEIVGLMVGKRILLVKTSKNTGQLQFKGGLAAMPPEVQSSVVNAVVAKHPEYKGAFLPYMLNEADFWDRDAVIAAIVGVLFAAVGIYLMGLSVFRQSRPDRHPLLAKLQQYGLVHDVRMRIDSEMRSEGGGEKFGPLHFTTNWVIQALAYKTHVMQSRDVVWAYQKITKHYHNGIPTGKTYSAILRDAKGQSIEVAGKKTSVPQMMQAVQRRMPWAVLGYSKELDTLWTKQKPQFNQLVEQRRAKLAMATR